MQETTALNRLGNVILWLGTAVLVVCIVASAVNAYLYVAGKKPSKMWVTAEDFKKKSNLELPPLPEGAELEDQFLTEEQAGFEFPIEYNQERGFLAVFSALVGVISWLVLASIAYIFNGRSPVAVIKGLFRRS